MRLGNYANYIVHRNIIKTTSNSLKNDYCFEPNGTLRDIVGVCDDVMILITPALLNRPFIYGACKGLAAFKRLHQLCYFRLYADFVIKWRVSMPTLSLPICFSRSHNGCRAIRSILTNCWSLSVEVMFFYQKGTRHVTSDVTSWRRNVAAVDVVLTVMKSYALSRCVLRIAKRQKL